VGRRGFFLAAHGVNAIGASLNRDTIPVPLCVGSVVQATHVEDLEPTGEMALILALGLVLASLPSYPFTFIPLAISRNWQTKLSILKKSRGRQGLEDPAPDSALGDRSHLLSLIAPNSVEIRSCPMSDFPFSGYVFHRRPFPSSHRFPSRRLYRKRNLWWML
jgi:hypothetical protein